MSTQDSREFTHVGPRNKSEPGTWRAALLSGTALAIFTASGVFFTPTDVLAACVNSGSTTTCTDPIPATTAENRNNRPNVVVNGNVSGEGLSANGEFNFFDLGRRNATFQNNGSVTSSAGTINGIDVLGYALLGVPAGSATYTGSGNVTGGQHGINLRGTSASTTTTGGNIFANNGNGINSAGALANDVNLSNTHVLGTNHGINLTGASSDVITSGGSVVGQAGNGINATALVNDIDLLNTDVSGGNHGINITGLTGNVTTSGSLISGGTGSGVNILSGTSGIHLADTVVFGTNGINVVGAASDIEVTGGSVNGSDGDGISSVVTLVPLVGGENTIAVDGTSISGSTNGINALTNGFDIGNSSIGIASTDVVIDGSIVEGGSGSGVLAITTAAGLGSPEDASTSVSGSGNNDISGGMAGVLAGAISLNGGATTTVDVSGDISGANGIIGVAGSVNSAGFSAIAADPSNLQNLIGAAPGDGKATVEIENSDQIVANSGIGIAALGLGKENHISATSSGTILADGPLGIGVLAASIGNGGSVGVHTNNVDAATAGTIALAVGDDNRIHGHNRGEMDAGLAGMIGVGVGDSNRIRLINDARISAGLIGMAGAGNGDGNSVALFNDGGIRAGVAGMVGIAVGNGNTVKVVNDGAVFSGGIGVAGVASGVDNQVNMDLRRRSRVAADLIGVAAANFGSGDVNVELGSNTEVHAGLVGISASSIDGNGDVNFMLGNNVDVSGGLAGIAATKVNGDGHVFVVADRNSDIEGGLVGLAATSVDGDGSVLVGMGANVDVAGGAAGIAATKVGGAGDVHVVTARNSDIEGGLVGLAATSVDSDGRVTVNLGTNVDVVGGAAGLAATKVGGDGDVMVIADRNSDIEGGLVGLAATSVDGDGSVVVDLGSNVEVSGGLAGVVAQKDGGDGDVTVDIGARSDVVGYAGVYANNRSAGDVTVSTGRGARVTGLGVGIAAHSVGNVSVSTGNRSRTVAEAGSAIVASAAGEVTVRTRGIVRGEGGDNTSVVQILSGEGASYRNSGLVASLDGEIDDAAARTAVNAKGGRLAMLNDGVLVGRVNLTAENDRLRNLDTWLVQGLSDFGDGTDRLVNRGDIRTSFGDLGGELTEFAGLESFINAGLLTMQGESVDGLGFDAGRDLTITSGDYRGVGIGTLAIDAYLGQGGSTADILRIGEKILGQTLLHVNDVNGGAGAYNPLGITFAEVLGGATDYSNFIIANGNAVRGGNSVIDKGLFFYDVALVDTPTDLQPDGQEFRLIGAPDHEASELPATVSGAQALWHESSGVWLDRQVDLRNQRLMAGTMEQGADLPLADNNERSGGVWARIMGSWTDRDEAARLSLQGNTYTFDTGYRQNTFGLVGGVDIGADSVLVTGDTFLIGVMGGYLNSSLDFRGSPTAIDYSGGLVGVYTTYMNKGFFADALFKADILTATYNAPTLGVSEEARVRTYGFTLDTGYRFELPRSLFIEPIATLSYARTKADDLSSIPGALVEFGDNDSFRGSVGVRFGGEVARTDHYRLEASVTGRIWDEFEGQNEATIFNAGTPLTVRDSFDRAFGELGGTLNVYSAADNWSGFVGGSYKFNDDAQTGTLRAGLRYSW